MNKGRVDYHAQTHACPCLRMLVPNTGFKSNAMSTVNVVKRPDIVTATGKKRVAMGGEDFHPQHTPVQTHRAISTQMHTHGHTLSPV